MCDYRKNAFAIEEAANLLDVKPHTFRNWVHKCGIESSRVGPIIMICRKKLEKWLRDVYPKLERAGKVRVKIDVERLDSCQ